MENGDDPTGDINNDESFNRAQENLAAKMKTYKKENVSQSLMSDNSSIMSMPSVYK